MASGSHDYLVKVWSMKLRKQLFEVKYDDWVNCVKVHGDVVISASLDQTVKLWNLDDGRLLHSLQHDEYCNNFDISDNLLSVAASDGLYIWSLSDRRKIKKIKLGDYVSDVRYQGRNIIAAFFNGEVHAIKME